MRSPRLMTIALMLAIGCTASCGQETVDPPPSPPAPPDTVSALGNWTLVLDRPLATKYEGMSFPDSLHGWVVSAAGEILRTTDGGSTWALQASGFGHLRSTDFLNASVGFAGTLSGLLYRTTDAGVTWTNITSRLPKAPIGVCGIAHFGNRVHVVGRFGGAADYFSSPDGGISWEHSDLGTLAQGLVDVTFLDDQVGLIGGMARSATLNEGPAIILKTTDGGRNWRSVFTHNVERGSAWKIFAVNTRVIYAALEAVDGTHRVVKSVDGGDNWEVQIVATGQPAGARLQGIGFLDVNVGWVGGFFTGMYATTNGGKSWSSVSVTSGRFNRYRRAGSTLFTAGTQGILRYDARR